MRNMWNFYPLLSLLKILQLSDALNENGICLDDKNNTKCCTDYVYNADEDRCVECVGRFGVNCSEACPRGFYGASCKSQCHCPSETCHQIWGCLRGTHSGVCYTKKIGAFCCADYMYLRTEHRCRECVGRFGVNCSRECPEGYYGKRCNENCSCEPNHCNKIWGCLSPPSDIFTAHPDSVFTESTELQKNRKEDLEWVFKLALPASLLAAVLLFVMVLGIAYRITNKRTTEIPNAKNSTDDEQGETSSTDIYAAVVRPNRKPIRDILQNDITYGNTLLFKAPKTEGYRSPALRRKNSLTYKDKQTLRDLNSPYSMCRGLDEVYDDTVCIPSSSDQFDMQRESLETH